MKSIKQTLIYAFALACSQNSVSAQSNLSLKIGDPAPAIKYSKWIKGEAIKTFDPSRLYILEFWATWCGPCKAAMPHLTKLQQTYKDKVKIIGVGISERVAEGQPYESSLPNVEKFVKGNAANMGYDVIADNNEQYMGNNWMKASGENGIPCTFIVQQNKVIWIGSPGKLDSLLPKILEGSYDMEAFAAGHNKKAETSKKQNEELLALFAPIESAIKAKEYKKAYALMEVLQEKRPEYRTGMELTKFKVMLDDNEFEAVELAKKLQKENPSFPSVFVALISKKDGLSKSTYLWAAKNFDAVKKDPDPVVLNTLATAYAKGGDYKMAVVHQEKALAGAQKALKDGTMPGDIMNYTVAEYEKALSEYRTKAKEGIR